VKKLALIFNLSITVMLCLFFQNKSFSQQAVLEAVYYDPLGQPYKIEKKYVHDDGLAYISSNDQSDICVKIQTTMSGDTMIVTQKSYLIYRKKSKLDLFMEAENFVTTFSEHRDTVWVYAYNHSASQDMMVVTADSMFVGNAVQDAANFPFRLSSGRVQLILDGTMSVNTDSLILTESIITYMVKGIPVKVKVLDANNDLTYVINATIQNNQIIYNSYYTFLESRQLAADTISINVDTTNIIWRGGRFDINQFYETEFQIDGNHQQITFGDTMQYAADYLENNNNYLNLLLDDLVLYEDVYSIELQEFERKKVIKTSFHGNVTTHEYGVDENKRIEWQKSFINGELKNNVIYSYR
jgi:hypothetical protein